MKLDLSKFKLKHRDDKIATLVHPDGHEFRVAVDALSPPHKKELSKLKLADGGQVAESHLSDSDIMEAKRQTDEYNSTHEGSSSAYPKEVEYALSHAQQGKLKMADGGSVDQSSQDKAMESIRKAFGQEKSPNSGKKSPNKSPNSMYADGGAVDPRSNLGQAFSSIRGAFGEKKPKPMYADGGEIPFDKLIPEEQASNKPFGLTDAQAQQIGQPGLTSQDIQNQASSEPISLDVGQSAPGLIPASVPIETRQQPSSSVGQQVSAPPAQQQAPIAPSDMSQPDVMKGYEQEVSGVSGEAQAQAQIAKDTETALKGKAQGLMDIQQQYQKHLDDLDVERKSLQQDIMDGHIDPSRYLGSLDTGARIQTGIALALGGLGGALTGGGNQALSFINQQIDRDIDAQKAELGKKETLLSANMRQYGNLREATEVTRLMMGDTAQTAIQQAMAKSGSQAALARGQQLLGQLQQQSAPKALQFALMRTAFSSAGGSAPPHQPGQGSPEARSGDAIRKQIEAFRFIDPQRAKDLEGRFDPSTGALADKPITPKDADSMTDKANLLDNIVKLRDFAKKNAGSLNPATISEGKALSNVVLNQLRTATDQGVIKPSEIQFDRALVDADPTKFFGSFRTDPKYKVVENWAKQELNGTRKQYGLPEAASPEESRLGPKEKLLLQLARKDPNHPKAKMIFQKLGVDE